MQIICSMEGVVSPKLPKVGIRSILAAGYTEAVLPDYEDPADSQKVRAACKFLGLEIFNAPNALVTNQTKAIAGHLTRGLYCDPTKIGRDVEFNLDVAAANACAFNLQDFIINLGPRLKMVTLSANYVPLTTGTVDYLGLIRGLRSIDFDGIFCVGLKFICNVPLTLRPRLIKYSYSVAQYLMWQVQIERWIRQSKSRVLFGAGNMCQAYMYCYGRDYPPLFITDNNPKLWGGEVEGYPIKSPTSLNELSEDCTILICNTYYKEIETQLTQMNLPNPIRRFNDEFLPLYPFGGDDDNA